MDEMKDADAEEVTKSVLVENYQRGEPTTYAFYGGFESREELSAGSVMTRQKNKNQPRRNEEREDFFYSYFVFFVSSWLFSEKERG